MSSIADGTRHFEPVLRSLLDRGHRVQVALDVERKGPAGDPALFEALAAGSKKFSWRYVPARAEDGWAELARDLRLSIDYLHFLEPRYDSASALRERSERRAPALVQRACGTRPLRTTPGRRCL